MEETIAKWILEHLIRTLKPDDKSLNHLLRTLPLPLHSHRLKKTLLLRTIEAETSNGSVSEKLLGLIETLEELDHREGRAASGSVREAYLMVAVDCTVRFLEVEEEKFREAVERVWRRRVGRVEGLWSEGVEWWVGELERAGEGDEEVCGRVLARNTRVEAVRAVRKCLREEWEALGPSLLELAVKEKHGEGNCRRGGGDGEGEGVGNKKVEGVCGGGGGEGEEDKMEGVCLGEDNGCREMIAFQGIQKVQSPAQRKRVGTTTVRQKGAKISDNDDEAMTNASDNPSETAMANADRVQEAVRSNPSELHAVVTDAIRTAQTPTSTVSRGNHKILVEDQTGPQLLATPEVDRVQEALKNSSKELHTAVIDPLPDALRAAETLISIKPTSTIGTAVENLEGSAVHATAVAHRAEEVQRRAQKVATNNTSSAHQTGPEIHISNVEKKYNLNDDAGGYTSPDRRKEDNPRKRSLMDPNDTSRTYEWDESVDNVSTGSPNHPRLPKLRRTPLKKTEDNKFLIRRERKRWTTVEEDTLRTAVKRFGKGNWKLILNCYNEIFQTRTDVDLKDKWRNMMRSS